MFDVVLLDRGFWIIQTLNTLQLAMLLFLLSVGLSVILGLMNFVNLAHGSFYALGVFIGYSIARHLDSFWLALVFAPVALIEVLAPVAPIEVLAPVALMRVSVPVAPMLVLSPVSERVTPMLTSAYAVVASSAAAAARVLRRSFMLGSSWLLLGDGVAARAAG